MRTMFSFHSGSTVAEGSNYCSRCGQGKLPLAILILYFLLRGNSTGKCLGADERLTKKNW